MRSYVVLAALVLAGPAGPAAAFEISSSSVSDGKWDKKFIADKAAGCDGQNVSIALTWKDPPAGTKSYMLTMRDPDALDGVGWWHWQMWNIPAATMSLPEGAGKPKSIALPVGAVQGGGDIGRSGYLGPCPPAGSGVHHYVITLYALKVDTLALAKHPTPTMTLGSAMGSVLGKATVTYTYGR